MAVRFGRGGEAGIATGVVLVALLMASGAAASTVLDVVNDSAERATAVASDAVREISTGLNIRDISGMAVGGKITSLQILIALQPGSPPIRLNSIIAGITTAHEHLLLDARSYEAYEILASGEENGILQCQIGFSVGTSIGTRSIQ